MAKLVRSRPLRSPKFYPVGTTLTLRDGRTFVVEEGEHLFWDDPTYGNGGPEILMKKFYKVWTLVA